MAESALRWWRVLLAFVGILLVSERASAEPVRILVAVSAKEGTGADRPLKHADRDADRVRDTFVRLGGVSARDVVRVSEPKRADLLAAVARARTLAAAHKASDVALFFYFSGHGDRTTLHLRGEELPLSELATAIGAVPARLRVVVTDACRTSDGRNKGPTTEPAFAIRIEPPPTPEGAVWVHASADGEVAQESDTLEGAVFTHYWLSGLAGAADADGDHRITLAEAYTFAYNQTLFRTAQSAGVLQRPTVDSTLKETSPFVLTQLGAHAATLRLPQGADTQYLVYTTLGHAVMAEAWSVPERRVEIGLPPGRYVVQRRGARSGAMEFAISKGQARDLEASDFRAVPEETLAQKGGELILRPHEASLAYAADVGTLVDLGQRVRAQYLYNTGAFAFGGGVDGLLGYGQNEANKVDVQGFGARVAGEYRLHLSSTVSFHLGLGLRALFVREHLVRRDASIVGPAGYPTERTATALLWGPELSAPFRFNAGAPAFFEVGPWATVLFGRRGDAIAALPAVGGEIKIGLGF